MICILIGVPTMFLCGFKIPTIQGHNTWNQSRNMSWEGHDFNEGESNGGKRRRRKKKWMRISHNQEAMEARRRSGDRGGTTSRNLVETSAAKS